MASTSVRLSAVTTSTSSSPSTSPLRRLGESVLTTSTLDPNMKHLNEVVNPPDFLTGAMANLSGQAADPFKIPPGTATAAGPALMLDSVIPDPADDLRASSRCSPSARSRCSTCICPPRSDIGTYKVDANFVAGGGIYQNANVTYRGVTIGRVDSVGLTDDGVIANMRLNSNTPVPDNVTATVKSVSAVGEQYIDLVPPTRRIAARRCTTGRRSARTARPSARTSRAC